MKIIKFQWGQNRIFRYQILHCNYSYTEKCSYIIYYDQSSNYEKEGTRPGYQHLHLIIQVRATISEEIQK